MLQCLDDFLLIGLGLGLISHFVDELKHSLQVVDLSFKGTGWIDYIFKTIRLGDHPLRRHLVVPKAALRHLRFEDLDTFFLGISVKDTSIYALPGESFLPFANGLQV
jgi:hypothetical protein